MIIKRRRIGGTYIFPGTTDNNTIISHILKDFCVKLAHLLQEYYQPEIGCQTLDTYEIFRERWGIPDEENPDKEIIFSEIPSDFCSSWIENVYKISPEITKRSFGRGEFPLIIIYKSYKEATNEFLVTYRISR